MKREAELSWLHHETEMIQITRSIHTPFEVLLSSLCLSSDMTGSSCKPEDR